MIIINITTTATNDDDDDDDDDGDDDDDDVARADLPIADMQEDLGLSDFEAKAILNRFDEDKNAILSITEQMDIFVVMDANGKHCRSSTSSLI